MNNETREKLINKLSKNMYDAICGDYSYAFNVIKDGFEGYNNLSDEQLLAEFQEIFDEEFDESEFVKGN